MRLRTIRAPGMAEAMARLRAEMGEEAVILSTRRTGDGVEVTAAEEVDDEPLVIAPQSAMPARAIPPALLRHNLPTALAARLGGAPLPAAIAAAFRFAPLPMDGTPLLLAGPSGAGKTLTAAKLATRLVLQGRVPLLVTADGRRAGATEQLAAFARVLGLPLAVAPSPSSLAKALARREAGQAVIVDLPGCDPLRGVELRGQQALIDAARGLPVLVLPAGLDAEEAAEVARGFHALGCRHLLPTRLDAARRLGGVLAAAEAGLAFTEAGTGPEPAGDLVAMDAAWLAARLEEGR
jgi:flagellar biosynthesis protein FlhF